MNSSETNGGSKDVEKVIANQDTNSDTLVEVVKRTRKRNQTSRVDTIVSSALSRNNPV